MKIECNLDFKSKYPSFSIIIEKLTVEDIPENLCWVIKKTHKYVTINDGEFIGVIHSGLSGLLKVNINRFRTIWFSRPDGYDRYIEIMLVE
jgi:hypothetical protein